MPRVTSPVSPSEQREHAAEVGDRLGGVHGLEGTRELVDVVGDAAAREPQPQARVAAELLHVVVSRGGWALEVRDPRLWLRLACGRVPYDVDELARALEPVHTSEAVPDLGRMLPLL